MYGSGAPTGVEITAVAHRPILKVLTKGRTACTVAVAGSTMRWAVVLLAAPSIALAVAATALGSVCPYKFILKSTGQRVNETMCQQVDEARGCAD